MKKLIALLCVLMLTASDVLAEGLFTNTLPVSNVEKEEVTENIEQGAEKNSKQDSVETDVPVEDDAPAITFTAGTLADIWKILEQFDLSGVTKIVVDPVHLTVSIYKGDADTVESAPKHTADTPKPQAPATPSSQICSACGGSGDCSYCMIPGRCNNCVGLGTQDCNFCHGLGSCSSCYGLGTNEAGKRCSTCYGRGYCRHCSGTGNVTCYMCMGSGSCNICKGLGTCTSCHGSGFFQ